MADKLEIFRFTCTVLVIGGTIIAISNPMIGLTLSVGGTLAYIFTHP